MITLFRDMYHDEFITLKDVYEFWKEDEAKYEDFPYYLACIIDATRRGLNDCDMPFCTEDEMERLRLLCLRLSRKNHPESYEEV